MPRSSSACYKAGASLLWIEDEDSANSAQTRAKLDQVCQALQAGIDVAVSVRLNKPVRSGDDMQRLQDALQFAALQCLQLRPLAGMVLVGGETAMKLYRGAGATALRMEGEVQPGIPCSRWIGGLLDGQATRHQGRWFRTGRHLGQGSRVPEGRIEVKPRSQGPQRGENCEGQRSRKNDCKGRRMNARSPEGAS